MKTDINRSRRSFVVSTAGVTTALVVVSTSGQALERLRGSILNFRRWSGPLQPHFAYGALDKKAYELAHAMHLANHLPTFHAQS